jgi:hypothetical protein
MRGSAQYIDSETTTQTLPIYCTQSWLCGPVVTSCWRRSAEKRCAGAQYTCPLRPPLLARSRGSVVGHRVAGIAALTNVRVGTTAQQLTDNEKSAHEFGLKPDGIGTTYLILTVSGIAVYRSNSWR